MNETIVKHLNFGEDAKDKIFEGINKLTQAVSSTLGASGKCVMLEDGSGNPQITKDGVTVANAVTLIDPVENMGAKLLKEAARKTVKEAGDGTTTATILAHAILTEAYKTKGKLNPRQLKEGINSAVDKVVKYLNKHSQKVSGTKIKQVATISANNDSELGKIISDAFIAVDKTGIVMMQMHDKPETVMEKIEGVEYEKGFQNNYFITNKSNGTVELENPYILILDSVVENIRKILPILEFTKKENKPLLIIGDVEQQLSTSLAANVLKGNLKVNIVNAPTYGINRKQTLDDLALLTGATVINEDLGDDMDLIQLEHLGKCVRAVSTVDNTMLEIESVPEEIDDLIKDIKSKVQSATNPDIKIKHEKRLAMLMAKASVVKVGANSEVELKEKKDRVEDAICATKAAIKEGIVPGGGIALLNASQNIKPESIAEMVLLNAISAPYETILENAGIEDYEMPRVQGMGLDVVTGETVSMEKSGIIDPLLVTKSALMNAASVATTILSTDCVINNLRA